MYEGRDVVHAATLSEEAFAVRGGGAGNKFANTPKQVRSNLLFIFGLLAKGCRCDGFTFELQLLKHEFGLPFRLNVALHWNRDE